VAAAAAAEAPAAAAAAAGAAGRACNLNYRLPTFDTPAGMLADMVALTGRHARVRNYMGVIVDMRLEATVVETELFPRGALEFYTAHNLDELDPEHVEAHAAGYRTYYNSARGGGQGDYRAGIKQKIANVVDALTRFPASKRAVLTIPPVALDHSVDGDAKCLRELHFYLEAREPEEGEAGVATTAAPEPEALHCTGFMRAQAASIFPKNIHFIGAVMNAVARGLGKPVGTYTHIVTTLTNER